MFNIKDNDSTPGVLQYNLERNRLYLYEREVHVDDSIEIYVFDAWIPGKVVVDNGEWYLLTADQVSVRLHSGLHARLCPLPSSSATSTSASYPNQAVQASPRVLLVDDDAFLLEALPHAIDLRLPQAQVDVANSAQDALRLIEIHRYDAIVSDIKMPGMDGLQLLEKIRAIQAETPTLLITGHGEQDLAIQALRGGAYDYIQKPIDREHFFVALLRAIQTCQLRRQVADQQRVLELHARSLERVVQQRTQELVEAHAAKDKVISLVSHELGGPIAHLKDVTYLLQRKLTGHGGYSDAVGADAAEIVAQSFVDIEDSLDRSKALIQELDNITRIETQLFIPHRKHCDLVALCQHILDDLFAPTEEHIGWQCAYGPINVDVDSEQIGQVLRSLLTHVASQASLEVPPTITLQKTSQEAIITLRDLGAYTHLGVDFYVARKILEFHNGHLEIQSFPGNRQTVFISLPLLEKEDGKEAPIPFPRTHAVGTIRPHP
jgi:FixJ family two-component response regulator